MSGEYQDLERAGGASPPPLVLVADDDPDILEAVCEILEGDGFRVARARHGREALDRYEEERPALIVLDLMMPVMNGFMFARALQAEHPDDGVPIVVISADGTAREAAALGARSFLPKPFDVDTLLTYVSDAVSWEPPGGGILRHDAPFHP